MTHKHTSHRGIFVHLLVPLFLIILSVFLFHCKKDEADNQNPTDIWDIDKNGIPKFVDYDFIDLSKINRISKYRSSIGHDYSDAFEHCRSLKHYFEPKGTIDWSSISIYSPVSGTITRLEQEWAGTKIEIAAEAYPAFRLSIFHVHLSDQRNIGDKITAGELLGTHIGSQTMSDISVIVNDPTRQGRMVSFFDVISETVFMSYKNRGVDSRQNLIISKELRDANPLTCNGDTFVSGDTLQNWVYLE